MCVDALSERRDRSELHIVAAFKNAHNTSLAELVCYLLEVFGQPLVVELANCCVSLIVNLVIFVGIETRRAENNVRLELHQPRENLVCELLPPVLRCHFANRNWNVEDASWVNRVLSRGVLNAVACSWIEY